VVQEVLASRPSGLQSVGLPRELAECFADLGSLGGVGLLDVDDGHSSERLGYYDHREKVWVVSSGGVQI
jgi:hypothetical protein